MFGREERSAVRFEPDLSYFRRLIPSVPPGTHDTSKPFNINSLGFTLLGDKTVHMSFVIV